MNDDEMRSILESSLREGGLDGDGEPDQGAIARRVRGARHRRTMTAALGAAASVALVAVIAWQAGAFDSDPVPPATPTETSDEPPTETPSADPTSEPTGEATDPGDWSDAVFPECGDTAFQLPERTSQLVVDGGPSGALPPGSPWPTVLRNTGSTAITGSAAILQTVVLDDDGAVVATVDPDDPSFWGAEGSTELAIGAGDELPFAVQPTFGCDGAQLPAGRYTAYVLVTVGALGETDPAALEQAQGGPFELTVEDGASAPDVGPVAPAGAVELTQACGDAWSQPDIQTGYRLELLDSIIASRPADNDIDGRSRLTVTSPLMGTVLNEVVLVADGRIVGVAPGTDAAPTVYLSAESTIDLAFYSPLRDCDQEALPPGAYQAVVVTVLYLPGTDAPQRWAIAATGPVDITLT